MRRVAYFILLLAGLLALPAHPAQADDSWFFPQTGHSVAGKFLAYWQQNGGLAVFGYPITDAQNEIDPETGKTFLTQWFERRRFELHPENKPPYEVLGGLIGNDLRRVARGIDPDFVATPPKLDTALPQSQQRYFTETHHNVRFRFLEYWQQNGGLDRFGFPISEEHGEVDPETGKIFMMQWFERARMEYHPENSRPYDVLLGLLGKEIKQPKPGFHYAWQIGKGYDDLSRPHGIALDTRGNLFVADSERDRIVKYRTDGTFELRWGNRGTGVGQFEYPLAVAADTQGNVYVLDAGNSRVQKFDSTGTYLLSFGSRGTADGQFTFDTERSDEFNGDLAVDKQGHVFVNDNQWVQKFDANGTLLTVIPLEENIPAPFPPGHAYIAVDAQGYLYTIDEYSISKFDGNGLYLSQLTYKACSDFAVPGGITVDAQGNIYITDALFSCFQKLSPDGKQLFYKPDHLPVPHPFDKLYGIAVDAQGYIYVADSGNDQIQKLDSKGGFVASWGVGNNVIPMWTDAKIAVDNAGTLYLSNDYHGLSVYVNGKFVRSFQGNGAAVATDRQNNLYVANSHGIIKYNSAGKVVGVFAADGKGEANIGYPTAIALDSKGNIYVVGSLDGSKNHIRKFDAQGNFVAAFGGENGPSKISSPFAITVGANDMLYVADGGTNRIVVFDSTGGFVRAWDGQSVGTGAFAMRGDVFSTASLAADSKGNVYFADTGNDRVLKFDSTGNLLVTLGGLGSATGAFFKPTGLALGADGTLYVADSSNGRIVAFSQR